MRLLTSKMEIYYQTLTRLMNMINGSSLSKTLIDNNEVAKRGNLKDTCSWIIISDFAERIKNCEKAKVSAEPRNSGFLRFHLYQDRP